MADDQHKKPDAPENSGSAASPSDRPAPAPATLGGLADLVKASSGGAASSPGGVSLGGLADLVKASPKTDAPPAAAPASPFDQKVGSAASQYTFVMNSSDLKDLIGDPNKQRVSVHSASSAGFDAAPRPAHSEPPPKPSTRDLPDPAVAPKEPPPRSPSRAAPRARTVDIRPSRSYSTAILLAVAVLLLFIFLLMQRNAALEASSNPNPATLEAAPSLELPAAAEE